MSSDEPAAPSGSEATLTEGPDKPTHAPKVRPSRRPPRSGRLPRFEDPLSPDSTLRKKGKLGEGGMGVVHLAEQGSLRREVAIKTLRGEHVGTDYEERLVREARVTGLVEHPNIVPVYNLVTDERGAPSLVMKRIEGVPWSAVLRDDGHAAIDDANDPLAFHVRVLMQVCDAVAFAHSKGILHLDLKPANVMLGAFREVYLVDWGVALSTREEHRGWLPLVDEAEELIGTPAYLAPEMVEVQTSRLDRRTDVYLLGSILHQLLTGSPPHKGADVHESLHLALQSEPHTYSPSVPVELSEAANRAMDKQPEDRFQDVDGFRRALAAFLAHRRSAQLAAESRTKLGQLEQLFSDEGDEDPTPLFSACRFGYELALRDWPDNGAARRGLAQSFLLMAGHHVERGDAQTALSLLDEMGEPPSVLAEAAGELRARAQSRLTRNDYLEDFRREQDPKQGRRARGRFIMYMALVLNLPILVTWVLELNALFEMQWWHSFAFLSAFAATMGLGALGARDRLMPNRMGRRIVLMLFLVAMTLLTQRVFFFVLDLPVREMLPLDVFALGAGLCIAATLTDRWIFFPAVGFLIAAALILLVPAHGLLWIFLAGTLGPAIIARQWMNAPDGREPTWHDRAP